MKTNFYDEPNKTVRQVLPYRFELMGNGKLAIKKTSGQCLVVSRVEVERMLTLSDLDVHRRRMYEAALGEFDRPPSASPLSPKCGSTPNLGEEEVQ